MNSIKGVIYKHSLLAIYSVVLLILLIGLISTSGITHIGYIGVYVIALLSFYFIINRYIGASHIRKYFSWLMLPENNNTVLVLFLISLVLLVLHLVYMGNIPPIDALSSNSTKEVVNIRRAITSQSNSFWNYVSSIHIKALIPFTILLLLLSKRYILYGLYLLLITFYAFILMQKSLILIALAPIMVFSIIRKRFYLFIKYLSIASVVIFSLVYISNPTLRGGYNDSTIVSIESIEKKNTDMPYPLRVFIGLNKRMFIKPGEIVSKWFQYIPDNKPFLYGRGYGFYNRVTGKEHIDYSKELYPLISPQYAKRGLKGSVNAASFMYDYSNFGLLGLILSAFIMAIILCVLETLYFSNNHLKISFNLFHVFMLSSGAITTALFSGGWGFINLFFIIFYKQLKHYNE